MAGGKAGKDSGKSKQKAVSRYERNAIKCRIIHIYISTVCPRSSDPFYIASLHIYNGPLLPGHTLSTVGHYFLDIQYIKPITNIYVYPCMIIQKERPKMSL